MWARWRKDLDCSWAALLAHSDGPRSLISLGMTAWYTGEALSITWSLTGRLLQPQKKPVLWNTHFLFSMTGNISKVIFMCNDIKCIFFCGNSLIKIGCKFTYSDQFTAIITNLRCSYANKQRSMGNVARSLLITHYISYPEEWQSRAFRNLFVDI